MMNEDCFICYFGGRISMEKIIRTRFSLPWMDEVI